MILVDFTNGERTWHLNIYSVLIILGLIYFFCSLFGYGNNSDTYAMIRTWKLLTANHVYLPSRPPGYLVPEMVVGATSEIGGFYLANLVSVFLGVAALWVFYLLTRSMVAENRAVLGVLAVGLNPFWVIAASSSIDFVYGAFFFLLGLFLLLKKRFLISGLFFGLAVSSRISYAPMVLLVFILFFLSFREEPAVQKKTLGGLAIFLFTSGLLYLPSFISAHMSLGFLHAYRGAWTLAEYIPRIIYKNIYVWGLPTFIFLVIIACKESLGFIREKKSWPTLHPVLWGGLLLFLYAEVLFAWLPHKIFYLIPILFIIIFAASFLENGLNILGIIIILNVIYMFINFEILNIKYNPQQNTIVSSTPSFFIDHGVLLKDLLSRSKSQKDYWKGMIDNRLEILNMQKPQN